MATKLRGLRNGQRRDGNENSAETEAKNRKQSQNGKSFLLRGMQCAQKGTSNLAEAALIGRYRYIQTHSVHSLSTP